MRIACIYLPSFPLQVCAGGAAERAAAPRAVAERGVITLCSRAAWELGVRPGMALARARQLAPDCEIVAGDAERCRQARDALAAALLPVAVAVEPGPLEAHQSIYVGVPRGRRGDGYGAALLEIVGRHGYQARVGVADDRFTAWAAAAVAPRSTPSLFAPSTTVVPRGGAAAFLAPLPLDLLPLSANVRHLLTTLGVRNLGDFAALPPPSSAHRWQAVDYQKLARGEGPTQLRPMAAPAQEQALAAAGPTGAARGIAVGQHRSAGERRRAAAEASRWAAPSLADAEPPPGQLRQRTCYHPRGPWRRCIDRGRRCEPARCWPSSRRQQRRGCWSVPPSTSSSPSLTS